MVTHKRTFNPWVLEKLSNEIKETVSQKVKLFVIRVVFRPK